MSEKTVMFEGVLIPNEWLTKPLYLSYIKEMDQMQKKALQIAMTMFKTYTRERPDGIFDLERTNGFQAWTAMRVEAESEVTESL